jgi:hypothetical protein
MKRESYVIFAAYEYVGAYEELFGVLNFGVGLRVCTPRLYSRFGNKLTNNASWRQQIKDTCRTRIRTCTNKEHVHIKNA